jgi:HD-like signal output (HDOD) protein
MEQTRRPNDRYGRGEHELTEEELAEARGPDLEGELSRLFASPGYQPPALPAVALKVMELSRRPQVEFDEVVRLLEQDPMLAAKVMARIQSAFYQSQNPVRTLKAAVLRLGIGGLRDLVLEVALNLRVFRAPALAGAMNALRRHSLVTAHCARIVCRYAAIEGEYAFLVGLLHDVGIAAALVAVSDGKIAFDRSPAGVTALWKAIEESHQSVSALVADLWKLPEELKLVLGNHHKLTIQGYAHPLIAALMVAEEWAGKLGAGLSGGGEELAGLRTPIDVTPPALLARAKSELRLGPGQQQCIEKDMAGLAAAIARGV